MEGYDHLGMQTMRVSQGKLFLSVILIAVFSLSCLAFQMLRRNQHSVQDEIVPRRKIEDTLTKLQSGNESDVLETKAELLEMGRIVIEPLISLLKELNNHAGERSLSAADYVAEQRKQSLDAHAKSMSENAIYDVLGQLHAAEAVPLLVIIMEEEEIDNLFQGMSPVMRALAQIGDAAVPRLIESIDTAAVLLASRRTQEALGNLVRGKGAIELGRIQLRATLVLGEIGDPRAVPALQRLQATTDNSFIAREASDAIDSIKNRTVRVR